MSQPSRRDWVIAEGHTPLRHRPFIGPTSHPVPSNSWRQLPAFISAPSSDQKPTFGSYHLDSFFSLQLRSRLSRPCHAILSRITKILVPDLASQVRSPRPVSLCEGLQAFQRDYISRRQVPSARSQLRRVRSEFASSRSCSPLPFMHEGFPTIRR